MRSAEVNRTTGETKIRLFLDLDGMGKSDIDTGVGFMDHMLTLLSKHAGFDLAVKCQGDTNVDDHHSVEDIGISLGQAFAEAIGDKRGIYRYADTTLAMDEALILTSVDISGRSYLAYDMEIPTEKVGTFDTELVEEFLLAFVRHAGITLHVRQFAGRNSHHIIEGMFKSLAHTLRKAVETDLRFKDEIPSTKGRLTELIEEEETISSNGVYSLNDGFTVSTSAPLNPALAGRDQEDGSRGEKTREERAREDRIREEEKQNYQKQRAIETAKSTSEEPVISRGLGDGSYAKGIAKGVTEALDKEALEEMARKQQAQRQRTQNDRIPSPQTAPGRGAGNPSGNMKQRVLRQNPMDQTRANTAKSTSKDSLDGLNSTAALERELQEKGLL